MTDRVKAILSWLSVLILVIGLVWSLTHSGIEQVDQITQLYSRKLSLLDRLKNLSEEEDNYEEFLDAIEGNSIKPFLYSGSSNAVQSYLQRDVRQIAAESKVRLASVRAGAQQREQSILGYRQLQLAFSATQADIIRFLSKIEAHQPLILVEKISIRTERKSTETSAAILAVSMDLQGFHTLDGESNGDAR
jgi:hypothetical protein